MSANAITTGGNLSNRRISKSITLFILAAACVAAYFMIAHFFAIKSQAGDVASGGVPKPQIISPPATLTADQSQGTTKQKVLPTPIGTFSQLTYQPGKLHAVRQLSGMPVDRQNKSSAWWIHPKTDEEARWMDTYGYPTASEEVRLRVASLDELKALADAGDLNAKAHWVGRSFIVDFEKGDFKSRNPYAGRAEYLLTDGGPYQATTFIQYYSQLSSAYFALPEDQRTGRNTQYLDDLGSSLKFAELRLKMVGDEVGLAVRADVYSQMTGYFQEKLAQFSADGLASSIIATARRRAEKGEPPLVIVPRPKQQPDDPTFYLERY